MFNVIFKNKLVIIALVVVIGFVGWYTLTGNTNSTDLLVTEDLTTPTSDSDRDLVATLLELRAVSLSSTIFMDPAFRSLVDFGIEIVEEPRGRSNPFAPLPLPANTPAAAGAAAGILDE